MATPRFFRNALFQIHWLTGITAGVVLALVGLTGAMLSFEHEVQDWLNQDVRTVQPGPEPMLAPAALLALIQAQHPDRRILSLQIDSSERDRAARVTFAAPPSGDKPSARPPASPPGRPRGETRFVDPYTGMVNEAPGNRGEKFFRGVMQLHRWLTWGDFGNQAVGKQIVGGSTVLCLFLAFSGLYLRWPAKGANWRTWLKPNLQLRGRPFLWNLHAVIGTWVLAFYVLMSLTGLQWSYEWYRKGLYSIAGVPMPSRPPGGGERAGAPARDVFHPQLDRAWEGFLEATRSSGYALATINLPRSAADAVEIRYLPREHAHERATNNIALDLTSGAVLKHERYGEKTMGGKLVASIFPLHSGSFFGVPGVVLYMLASLLMPVFAVTGWLLYLKRRRAKAAARAGAAQLANAEAN